MPEYVVVWDGSRSIKSGYLNAVPEERREPPKREDWSKFFPPDQAPSSVVERLAALLKVKSYTSRELVRATGIKMSAVSTALARLRRTGHLRNKKSAASEGLRHWVNYYWLEP